MTTIQTINLGNYANDGTGDDLRTAFTKVNSNFNLLFGTANVVSGVNLGTGSAVFADKNPNTLNLEFKTLTSIDSSIRFTSNTNTLDLSSQTHLSLDTSPQLSANLNLNGYHTYGGDTQTTIYGLNFPVTNSIVSAMVGTGQVALDLGSFTQPTGWQHSSRGYSIDLNGGAIDGFTNPLVNDYDFGTLNNASNLQIGGFYLTLGGNLSTRGGNITFNVPSGTNTVSIPSSGTLATTSLNLGAFASTSSAQLASVISDETGSGKLVFATSPTLAGSVTLATGGSIVFPDGSSLSSAAGLGGTNTIVNGSFTVTLDSSGVLNLPNGIRFQDGSVLATSSTIVSKSALKSIVAASTSFTDFQTRIAAL